MRQMTWYNEPVQWEADEDSLAMQVTPKTDYWRKTHYGFTVDDGPFYFTTCGGEFEAKVRVTGEYQTQYDQMGLMLRVNEQTWIKAGVEYVNSKINLSAVVTINQSDWSVIELAHQPTSVWFKAVRQLDAVELSYSFNDETYTMMRLAFFPDHRPVMVGLMAASPDGEGFRATFDHFSVKHIPDARRLRWLNSRS